MLFDFDGTLLDSFSVHYAAYEAMFARFGIACDRDLFLKTYSPNWYHTYQVMGLGPEAWDLANSYWLEEAARRTADLFPRVKETLRRLGRRYRLGLVTSGSRDRVLKDLERTGIGRVFHSVVTGDDVRYPKPAPEGLELALDRMGIGSGEAVYVGDARADYEMARAAGVYFVGVESEFSNLAPDPDCPRIDSVEDLLAFLDRAV